MGGVTNSGAPAFGSVVPFAVVAVLQGTATRCVDRCEVARAAIIANHLERYAPLCRRLYSGYCHYLRSSNRSFREPTELPSSNWGTSDKGRRSYLQPSP